MKRIVVNSPRLLELKKKKLDILKRKILIFFGLFLIVFICFVFLLRWERLNIQSVSISGNKVLESKILENIVNEKIAGNYLWVIPKTNFLFYPKQNIKKELTNQFKRIKEISFNINTKDVKTLEITLSEREPKYTWCGDNIPTDIEAEEYKCYFTDNTGYIFDEAPYFSGGVYFQFFGKIDNLVKEENQEYIPSGYSFMPEVFPKYISFINTLNTMGVKSSALLIKEDGDLEFYLASKATLLNAPKIILKKDFNLEKSIENLQAALSTEPLSTDFKNKYSSLLYFDLRFGNKVYYKFND